MNYQHELPLASKLKLVEALLACECLKNQQSRDQVVADLPAEICNRINRHQNSKQDVNSIVTTSLQFTGGLDKLLEVVKYYEGNSLARQELESVLGEIYNASPKQPPTGGITLSPSTRNDSTVESGTTTTSTAVSEKKYDVFLSHSSQDKPTVEKLAVRLEDEGRLKPFLDKWHLVPGEPWQEALEEALNYSATCAVCLGPNGLGPWENEEMRSALDERVRDKTLRVIPVLLPGANPKDEKTLPRFLRRLTWVDFRAGVDSQDAFRRLIAGIRGHAPGRGSSSESR